MSKLKQSGQCKTLARQAKGITLVALIITIIVLLILTMVSIRLVMNGGIIDRANRGTQAYSEAEIQEQIKLAYSEWQTARWTGETSSAADFVKARLEKTYGTNTVDNVTETEGVFTVKFKDGREYTYNVTTGTTAKVAKWNDNGDGTWTHSETGSKIQIGDVVNYDPTKDENGNTLTTTYTSYAEANAAANKNEGRTSGYTTDQSFSVSATTNGWRVLGINESGQIELISADPIQTSASSNYYLKGEKGYFDGPDELNAICGIFGQGKGAESARSLDVDDVNKLAGITTDADKKACKSDYGSKWQYRYPTTEEETGTRYMQYKKDTGSGYGSWTNITSSNRQKFKMPGDTDFFGKISNDNIVSGYSPELTYTYYSYTISSKVTQTAKDGTSIANILSKGSTSSDINQWLASSCVSCGGYDVGFRVRNINGGSVDRDCLFSSNGYSSSSNRRVRPVVSLKSNVNLQWNSTSNKWEIQ